MTSIRKHGSLTYLLACRSIRARRIAELLPWNWKLQQQRAAT
jgi:hypothetical protein